MENDTCIRIRNPGFVSFNYLPINAANHKSQTPLSIRSILETVTFLLRTTIYYSLQSSQHSLPLILSFPRLYFYFSSCLSFHSPFLHPTMKLFLPSSFLLLLSSLLPDSLLSLSSLPLFTFSLLLPSRPPLLSFLSSSLHVSIFPCISSPSPYHTFMPPFLLPPPPSPSPQTLSGWNGFWR